MRLGVAAIALLLTILQYFEQSQGQMYHYSRGWNAGGKRSATRYTMQNMDRREKSVLELLSIKCRISPDLKNLLVDLVEVSVLLIPSSAKFVFLLVYMYTVQMDIVKMNYLRLTFDISSRSFKTHRFTPFINLSDNQLSSNDLIY